MGVGHSFRLKYYHTENPKEVFNIIETASNENRALGKAKERLKDYEDVVIFDVENISSPEYYRRKIRSILQ